ncbi:PadR family transcriptional regulator [Spongiactinospora rosea]|uniref:PadR family transcriptional regulator n=1 Tax=Spongiactinospora rosea TaxID=2248750 RepID=A0A366M3A4_9ACTN|nr:PadR family transcriptional regulator [Spongiactinospora rosea]RBQ20675.1 PadR family transcriptional regulator [Spongiactinospora rosea]
MNSARLFVLSILARRGPMHGYQIRQEAKLDRTELWTDIKPGSLYNVLHRMEQVNFVEVVRTERGGGGNSPERTVYAITDEGRAELLIQRDAALRDVRVRPDPVDLALQYVPDLSEQELRDAIDARRQALLANLAMMQQEHRTARPYLTGLEPMLFEHNLARLRAEIAWHEALLEELPTLLADT